MSQSGTPSRIAVVGWLLALGAVSALVLTSGGLRSPFLPFLCLPSVLALRAGLVSVPLILLPQLLTLGAAWWITASLGTGPEAPWVPVQDVALLAAGIGLAFFGASALRAELDATEQAAAAALTARLNTEAARARELELLSGAVAHELKNPLTAVRSLVAHFAAASDAAPAMKALADQVRQLSTRIDDFLTTARTPAAEPATEANGSGFVAFARVAHRIALMMSFGFAVAFALGGMEKWRVFAFLLSTAIYAAWVLPMKLEQIEISRVLWPPLSLALVTYLLAGGASGPVRPALIAPLVVVVLVTKRQRDARAFLVTALGVVALGGALALTLPRALVVPQTLDLSLPGTALGLGGFAQFVLAAWPMVAVAVGHRRGRLELAAAQGRVLSELTYAAEAQETRWRALEQFLSRVVEGLQPSLHVIEQESVALRDEAAGRTRERMDVVVGELRRMKALLDDVGCLPRPPSAQELQPASVRAALGRRLPSWTALGLARRVTVRLVEGVDCTAVMDTMRFDIIVTNLVKNAIEASGSDAQVQLQVAAADGGIAVTVDDDGVGLSAALADRLFTAGATTKSTGSGLGLFISRRLAAQLRATLTLSARVPAGCRATLVLEKGSR